MAAVLTESRESVALIDGPDNPDIAAMADLTASLGLANSRAFVHAQTAEGRVIYDRWYPGYEAAGGCNGQR